MISPEEMDSDYIEACILSNTANQIADQLEDLDRLFVIYHDKSLINNYNRLLRELKQIRMHLNGY